MLCWQHLMLKSVADIGYLHRITANQYIKDVPARNETRAEIGKRVKGLLTQVGAKNRKLTKWWETKNPSIQ
ncbi:hypothetical protein SARC_13796, partial [Sphaeroforma arctica JP610]